MTKLNHCNLSVSNVTEVCRFFEACFGFETTDRIGEDKLVVMHGEDGGVLTLMYDKTVTPDTYPRMFHIGFLEQNEGSVVRRHQRMVQAGFAAPEPAVIHRGGPKTFGFYYTPPGGVVVEVSCPAE